MKPSDAQAFRIHGYEVDPRNSVVRGPGGRAKASPEALAVLVDLAGSPGEPVHFPDVAPHALAQRIDEARELLGGAGGSDRLIEPAGDGGYRLMAPVTQVAGSWLNTLREKRVIRALTSYAVSAWLLLQIVDVLSGALPVPDWTMPAATIAVACGFPIAAIVAWTLQITPAGLVLDVGSDAGKRVTLRWLARHFDIVVVALLVAIVLFVSYGQMFARAPAESRFAVAVLPFENVSGNANDQYLSDGLADDVRARLSSVPQLLVAASSSSRALAAQSLEARDIGRRLGVEHILEGSIRRQGERIRVSVQLVDVATGFNRWSNHYDTDLDRLLGLESDIALVVANELELLLSRELRTIIAATPTDDAVAHGLYLRAREAFYRPRTEKHLAEAQQLFEQSLASDTRFALAQAGLCRTLLERYAQSGDTRFFDQAEQQCPRARALDDTSSDAHTALGEFYLAKGQVGDAIVEFETAIAINVRALDAQTGLANALAREGRNEEAEAQYQAAVDLLPGNWRAHYSYGNFLLQSGRFDAAIDNFRRTTELTPGNANAYNNLGAAAYLLGDFEQAGEAFSASLALDPNRAAYSNTGVMYYYAGDYARAAELFQRAVDEAENDYRLWGNLADAQRFNEADDARARYLRAIDLALAQLEVDPENRDVITNLAWYQANLGRTVAAREYLDRALTLGEPSAEQHYTRAVTLALLGETAAALIASDAAAAGGVPVSLIDATVELQPIRVRQADATQ